MNYRQNLNVCPYLQNHSFGRRKVADKLYLVRKGCLRLFFYNEGKDITFQFFFEGNFVASFDSLYKRTPSLFYLESIEPTELAAIRREDFYNLIDNDSSLRQLYEEKLIDRFHVYQQLFLSRIKIPHNSDMKNC